MGANATKDKIHEVDPPKDDAVAEELTARQQGEFEGFPVAAIGNKLQAGEVVMDSSFPKPKAGDLRCFVVKGKLVKMPHEIKKGAMIRVNEFEIVEAQEVSYAEYCVALHIKGGAQEPDAE